MKVILLKDIRKVGKKYETKVVSDGYALNFLIPQKMAEVSTEKTMRRIDALKAKHDSEMKINEDLLMKNLKALEGTGITVVTEVNDKGHLFKGIHQNDISTAIKEQTQLDITPEYIMLEKPIKEVGEHELTVQVQDKKVTFKLTVVAK